MPPTQLPLSVADQRAIRKAIEAHLREGAFRTSIGTDIILGTAEDRFLLRKGICVASSIDELEGAVLVGWLVSSGRSSGVGGWWRRGARALMLVGQGSRQCVFVSAPTALLDVGGRVVDDGFATQEPRFVAGHDDRRTAPEPPRSTPPPTPWAMPDLFDAFEGDDGDDESKTPVWTRQSSASC